MIQNLRDNEISDKLIVSGVLNNFKMLGYSLLEYQGFHYRTMIQFSDEIEKTFKKASRLLTCLVVVLIASFLIRYILYSEDIFPFGFWEFWAAVSFYFLEILGSLYFTCMFPNSKLEAMIYRKFFAKRYLKNMKIELVKNDT